MTPRSPSHDLVAIAAEVDALASERSILQGRLAFLDMRLQVARQRLLDGVNRATGSTVEAASSQCVDAERAPSAFQMRPRTPDERHRQAEERRRWLKTWARETADREGKVPTLARARETVRKQFGFVLANAF